MNENRPLVVVTRPEPECSALVERLQRRGVAALANPAFRLVATAPDELRAALGRLAHADFIVVVSPFAARLVADHEPRGEGAKPLFIAPGPGTGRILERAGLAVARPDDGGNSEAILALPQLDAVEGRSIAIFGAPGGRRLLDEELTRRGAEVQRIDGYRRVPEPPGDALLGALREGRRLAVLVSSLNALTHLCESLPASLRGAWLRSTFVVSSPRLAQACRARGAERIVEASGAADDRMLDALGRLA